MRILVVRCVFPPEPVMSAKPASRLQKRWRTGETTSRSSHSFRTSPAGGCSTDTPEPCSTRQGNCRSSGQLRKAERSGGKRARLDELSQDFGFRSPGAIAWPVRAVYKAVFSVLDISSLPFIKSHPTNSELPTGFRDIMGYFLEVPEDAEPPFLIPEGIVVCHKASPSLNALSLSKRALGVNLVCQF